MNETAAIILAAISGSGLGVLGLCFARWAGMINDKDWAAFWGRKPRER